MGLSRCVRELVEDDRPPDRDVSSSAYVRGHVDGCERRYATVPRLRLLAYDATAEPGGSWLRRPAVEVRAVHVIATPHAPIESDQQACDGGGSHEPDVSEAGCRPHAPVRGPVRGPGGVYTSRGLVA